VQAFGRLENHSDLQESVETSLYLGDVLLDAKTVDLPPRDEKTKLPGTSSVTFEMQEIEAGVLKLQIDAKDNLPADNTAYAVVNIPRPARVLVVSPGTDALLLALQTDEAKKIANVTVSPPSILETKSYQDQATDGTYDLVIYDQCAPKEMPACNTLFVGALPPKESLTAEKPPGNAPADTTVVENATTTMPGWTATEKQGLPVVIDVNQVHPLTQLVQMGNVKIGYGRGLKGPPGTVTLIDSDAGVLYAVGPRGGYEDAVLGFDIVTNDTDGKKYSNTDWPIRRSFPVFIMNALKYLGGVRGSLASPNILPGSQSVLRTATPVKSVIVTSPRGDRFEIPRELQNTFVFSRTDELGVYEVREGSGSKVSQQFAVNLFDTRESNLTPADEIEIGHEGVKAEQGHQVTRKELWKWLALGALGMLMFEWYIYNRRVYL
jgi:hypothetical protein